MMLISSTAAGRARESLENLWKATYGDVDFTGLIKCPYQIVLPFAQDMALINSEDVRPLLGECIFLDVHESQHAGRSGTFEKLPLLALDFSSQFYNAPNDDTNRHEIINGPEIISKVWDSIVAWVAELCQCRPISLHDWFILSGLRYDSVGLYISKSGGSRLSPMEALSLASKGMYSDRAATMERRELFRRERNDAIARILGIIKKNELAPPLQAGQELFHWVGCPFVSSRELQLADRVALAATLWITRLDKNRANNGEYLAIISRWVIEAFEKFCKR